MPLANASRPLPSRARLPRPRPLSSCRPPPPNAVAGRVTRLRPSMFARRSLPRSPRATRPWRRLVPAAARRGIRPPPAAPRGVLRPVPAAARRGTMALRPTPCQMIGFIVRPTRARFLVRCTTSAPCVRPAFRPLRRVRLRGSRPRRKPLCLLSVVASPVAPRGIGVRRFVPSPRVRSRRPPSSALLPQQQLLGSRRPIPSSIARRPVPTPCKAMVATPLRFPLRSQFTTFG